MRNEINNATDYRSQFQSRFEIVNRMANFSKISSVDDNVALGILGASISVLGLYVAIQKLRQPRWKKVQSYEYNPLALYVALLTRKVVGIKFEIR